MRQTSQKVRARLPTALLKGKAEQNYVADVVTILDAARLNNHYPDARRLAAHIRCMGPDVHRGLYPGLEVDLRSGLPSYQTWTRVQTDAELAPAAMEQIHDSGELERKARKQPGSIYARQLTKVAYYQELRDVQLAPLSHMDVALRRVDPESRSAYFRVRLDKLDVSGMFLRYTIELSQTNSIFNCAMVNLTDEIAAHTEEFKSLIYRVTSVPAELMFTKLIAVGGLRVERVIKGVVGPVYFSGINTPDRIRDILRKQDGFLASFSLEMAAVDLAADRDNDPMLDLMEDQLSDEARETYRQARGKYGFKVFLDRKFVVSESVVEGVRRFCQSAGTRNIISAVKRSEQT